MNINMKIFNKKILSAKFRNDYFLHEKAILLTAEADKNLNLKTAGEFSNFSGIDAASFDKLLFVLNPGSISFKILNYPFKLKGADQIRKLCAAAIEEFTPFKPDELYFIPTVTSSNSILLEYIKKDDIKEILDDLKLNWADKKRIKFYFPYSLLLKTAIFLKINEINEKAALIYNFEREFYGILFEGNKLKDVIYTGLLFHENNENAALVDTAAAKINETYALKDYTVLYLSSFIKRDDIPAEYLDLYFLLTLKKDELPSYIDIYRSDKNIFKNYLPVLKYSSVFLGIILLMVLVWTTGDYYNKLNEKTVLASKIDSILKRYMPGKKYFYKPESEIRNYYRTIKQSNGSETGEKVILNLIRYVSASKQFIGDLRVKQIGYSLGRFSLKGSVGGYGSLDKLENYLKKKYSKLSMVKSYKNSQGLIKFTIYIKNIYIKK